LWIFSTGIFAQEQYQIDEDSLRSVYYETEEDSVKLSVAYYFMFDYEISNPDSAVALAKIAKELAEKTRDTAYLANINKSLGNFLAYQGDYRQSLKYTLEALKLFEITDNQVGISGSWNNIGENYYELDLYGEAFDYYNKALNKSTEINDSLGRAVALYNVGKVLKAMGQYQKAKKTLQEAKALSETIGDLEGIPYVLNDIGEILIYEQEFDKALSSLEEALEICIENEEAINFYVLTPEILNKIAIVYREKEVFEEALNYHNRANKYFEQLGNEGGVAETLLEKGKTYESYGQLGAATRSLNKGLAMGKDANNKGVQIKIYKELSEIYEKQNEYDQALDYYKNYKAMGDSLFSEKKSEQFAQLQVKYETQKKDVEIALLNEREQQRKDQLKNEEFLRNVLVVILAFTAVLLVTLYRSSERRKKINELLILHQKEIEAQSKELEKLLEMKDKFFSIVSHDLRSPINALVGILDMQDEGHLTQDELKQLTKSLRIRLNNTRKLLDNLLDWAMLQMNEIDIKEEELKLKAIVEENLTFFREVNDKDIKFFNKVEGEIARADRNMLDLIIRNLISNSIKFTGEQGAVEVFVEHNDKDNLTVCISDDGVGMSQEQTEMLFDKSVIYTTPGTSNEKGTGLGLKLCKEFVERMGGKIWVESEEDKGSTFKFTIKKA